MCPGRLCPGPKVGLSLPRPVGLRVCSFRIQSADHHRRIPAPGVVHHRGEPRRLGRARLTGGAAPPLGFRFRRSRGRGAKGCAAHDLLESPTHTVCHTLTHSRIVCCCIQNVLCCTQGVSRTPVLYPFSFAFFSSCKKSFWTFFAKSRPKNYAALLVILYHIWRRPQAPELDRSR